MSFQILQGNVLDRLRELREESVHCVVTSPPYWGLRNYGMPDQIGLEPTPEAYIARMVEVFREVRRVLRSDGTLWLNMGDSYSNDTKWGGKSGGKNYTSAAGGMPRVRRGKDCDPKRGPAAPGQPMQNFPGPLKPKDLVGMPWRLAFALQEAQHYGPIKLDTDRAWLAALIDGEGTISIKRDKGRSNGGNGECQHGYSAFISIGNQDRELLDKCVAITGYGSVGVKSEATTDGRGIKSKRRSYGWWISSNQAITVIRDIYPFLVIKRRQAVLAYNLNISNKAGKSLRGNGPLPQSEQDKRQNLKEVCNKCNQREPVDLPSWLVEPPSNFEQGWWLRQEHHLGETKSDAGERDRSLHQSPRVHLPAHQICSLLLRRGSHQGTKRG